jgi:methionyl-tRNA formyltransferase
MIITNKICIIISHDQNSFLGSSQHSVTILQKLVSLANFSVVQVVTKQDKPVGRDQKITPNPVAQFPATTTSPYSKSLNLPQK